MASQRQADSGRPAGSAKAGNKNAGDRYAAPRNKAEAGKAQARAAAQARADAQATQSGKATKSPQAAQQAGTVTVTGPELPPASRWLVWTTWVLSLAGLGVSIYLTIEHFTSNSLAGCPENSTFNCTKVTTSPESMVFGVIPVAILGLAFYVFLAAANSPWAWRLNTRQAGRIKLPSLRAVRAVSLVIGIGFVLYLVYVELFQVDAICLYCTSVHIITFILFCLIVFDATFRQPEPPDKAQARRR